jgi:hypothetical protein
MGRKSAHVDGPAKRYHWVVRCDQETLDKIDGVVAELSTEWHQTKRSEALRCLVQEALAAREKKRGTRRSKGRG